MSWLWLNIPLMAVFFLAMTGIPLWLVFKRPDTGPDGAQDAGRQVTASSAPGSRRDARSRELAGASR